MGSDPAGVATSAPARAPRLSTADPALAVNGGFDDRRTVARGGLLTLVGATYAAAMGFALTVVVGRIFGAHESGLFFMSVAVFMILNGLVLMGSDTGMVRALSAARATGAHREVPRILAASVLPVLAWSLVVAGVLAVATPEVARLLAPDDVGRARDDLGVLVFALVLSGVGQACLNGTRAFGGPWRFVVLYQLWLPTSRLGLVLALWLTDASVRWLWWAWALPLVAMDVVALAWMVVAVSRDAHRPGAAPRPTGRVASDVWRFNLPRGLASMLEIGIVWVDVLVVGALMGPAAAGAYAAASRFITSGTMAMEALRIACAPQFAAAAARRERARLQELHAASAIWLVLLAWPVFVTLAAFAPLALSVMGDGFGMASDAMTVMSLGILGYLAMGNINSVLLMAGLSRVTAGNTLIALGVNIALNLALVPVLGLSGAAIAWSVSLLLDSALCTVRGHRRLGLRPPGAALLVAAGVIATSFGVPALLIRLLAVPSAAWLAAYAVVGCAVYAVLLHRYRAQLHLSGLLAVSRRQR